MRKGKIAKLFEWENYEKAQTTLVQNPDDKAAIKKAAEQDKALKAFSNQGY